MSYLIYLYSQVHASYINFNVNFSVGFVVGVLFSVRFRINIRFSVGFMMRMVTVRRESGISGQRPV